MHKSTNMCIWHVTANGEILHHPHVNLLHGSCKHIFVFGHYEMTHTEFVIFLLSRIKPQFAVHVNSLLKLISRLQNDPNAILCQWRKRVLSITVTRIQYTFILTGYKIKCKLLVLFTWCLWKLLLYKKVNNLSLDIHVNA